MAERIADLWRTLPRPLRRLVAGMVGGAVLLAGIVMIALPGPAILVIPLGVSILCAEFAAVRRVLRRVAPRFAPADRDRF